MLPIWCVFMALGVEVCKVGTAWIETSFVEEMFSLETDSDLTEMVPRLSLPLLMEINEEKRT